MKIASNAPLFFDGAFGTYYHSLTGDTAPCEYACLTAPQTVLQIHQAYLHAGSRAISTNTFAANPQTIPDETQLQALLKAGLSLGLQAAEGTPEVQVFADIGGIDSANSLQDYFTVAKMFHQLGACHYLFETLAELEPILPALHWLKEHQPEAVIFVSFAVTADGYTRKGLFYRLLLEECGKLSMIDAAGLNCLCGPSHMVSLFSSIPSIGKPLIAMPNAGYPSTLNGRLFFEDNSTYFADKVAELYAAGADILGGCCGSTPQHIQQAVKAVYTVTLRTKKNPITQPNILPAARVRPTHKLIAIELDPPLTPNCEKLFSAANLLAAKKIDWITIADSPLARARMDSILTAAKLLRETGIHVLPHLSCRDRNAIGMKAVLLGASAENIDELLIVTGDAPTAGGGVFNFHAASLMRYITELNSDVLKEKPFRMAGALNINACNFATELDRARKKLDNGATMLLTQPIFSAQAIENLFLARQQLDCVLLAGILPVAGYKNALFLANEVTGIVIPDDLLEQLRQSPNDAVAISVEFAAKIAAKCYPAADGFYIMTPLGKTEIVCGLLEQIQKLERKGESR